MSDVRTLRRSRAISRPSKRRALRAVLAIVAVIAIAAGIFHRAIAAAAITAYVKTATGYNATFGDVEVTLSGARLSDVRMFAGGPEPVAVVEHIDARIDWRHVAEGGRRVFGVTSIDLRRPAVTLERSADGTFAGAWTRPPETIDPLPGFHADVEDGTIVYRRSPNSSADTTAVAADDTNVRAVTGAMTIAGNGTITYHARMDVNGDPRYRVDGSATVDPAGITTHHWTAHEMPLTVLAALRPADAPIAAEAGMVEDVDLRATSDPSAHGPVRWHGDAHLIGGTFTDGPAVHISGAHGRIVIDGDGVATPKIEAMLGSTPLHLAGVLRDPKRDGFRWALEGSDDFIRFERVFAKVAAQPNLQDVRLEALAPGVDFAQVATHIKAGPVVYTVMSVDPREPTVRLGAAIAQDTIVSGGERTSVMAERIGALAGVNGDYYDIGRTYAPQGIVVRDGILLRTPIERYALSVHANHTVTFDMYHFHGEVRTPHARFRLTQVNDWPARNVTLITPEFGGVTPVPSMTFVALSKISAHRFRVTAIPPDGVKTEPTYGLLFGDESAKAGKPPRVGEVVDLTYDTEPSLRDVTAAVGGGPLLVKDGAWFEDPHAPAPDERDVHWSVVGVGKLADQSLLFMEVDGRHPLRSVGMTRPEFADLMIAYNVTDGFALDSGGSATLVARPPFQKDVAVRTVPSDDSGERWISDGFFVYSDAPRSDLAGE